MTDFFGLPGGAAPAGDQLEHWLREAALRRRAGDLNGAVLAYEQVLRAAPDNPAALVDYAAMLLGLRRPADALAGAERAIALDPRNGLAHGLRGTALRDLDRLDEAVISYDTAIALNPQDIIAQVNRANTLRIAERLDEALAAYDAAIALKPDLAEAHSNRAMLLLKMERPEDALAGVDHAIALKPHMAGGHGNRAVILCALDRDDDAIAAYGEAMAINPNDARALNGRGAIQYRLGRLHRALADFEQALAINPEMVDALVNQGKTLHQLGKWPEAVNSFNHALALDQTRADAFFVRGCALQDMAWPEQALADYNRALEIDPNYKHAPGGCAYIRRFLCDWAKFEDDNREIANQTLVGESVATPFTMLSAHDDGALQKVCADAYIREMFDFEPLPGTVPISPAGGKIRLAYLSADFHYHATMQLLIETLELHDRDRFEVIALSYGPAVDDAWRQRTDRAVDQFIDVRDMSDQAVVELARRMGVDIAIDLKGHTSQGRTGIMAQRAAPIQVNFLGFPGTMGGDFMDYIVADPVIVPEASRAFYAEKVAYMPHTYQANCKTREIAEAPLSRADAGLPGDAFVFCSFNSTYKLTPAMFDVWMHLLGEVEGSVLWILLAHEGARGRLRGEAKARGIDPDRLVFADFVPVDEHLARLRLADLFLDSYPCTAHTTASDALRMGVPLVTVAGESFVSRVPASLLTAVGAEGLITASLEDYEKLALDLATNPARLAAVRKQLADKAPNSPLFDSARFTRDLEALYEAMVARARAGQAPDHITL